MKRDRLARMAAFGLLWILLAGQGFAGTLPDGEDDHPPPVGSAARAPAGAKKKAPVLRFEGNSAFSKNQLREAAQEELSAYLRSGRRADVDDAAYMIQNAYLKAGYHFATVNYESRKSDGRDETVITITEGPQVAFKKVAISGNTVISSEELRTFFNVHGKGAVAAGKEVLQAGFGILGGTAVRKGIYVASDIAGALTSIRNLYYERGFLDIEISPPEALFSSDRSDVSVSFSIREGRQYVVSEIRMTGTLPEEVSEAVEDKTRRLVGKPYYSRRKALLKSLIVEACGLLGYPEPDIKVIREAGGKPGDVILEAHVDAGPKVTVSSVRIEGNRKTRERHLRTLLAFKAGDTFTSDKKRDTFKALYRTGLFSKVQILLGEDGEAENRPVTVLLEEAPSRELSAEIGWGSYDLLRGRVSYRDLNLFGLGRTAAFGIGGSLKGEEVELELIEPRFLGWNVRAGTHLHYRTREEPSFTKREVGAGLSFSSTLWLKVVGTVEYRLTLTDLTDISPGVPPEELDKNYRLGTFGAQLSRDTRNDIFFPTSGHRISLGGRVADPLTGSQISFFQVAASGRFFTDLGHSTVLGMRYQTGFILPTRGQVSVPVGERLFNGGESTVRSFSESELGPQDLSGNPSGGLATNVVTIELRRRLGGNFAGSVFADFGNVSPNRTQAQKGEEPFTNRSDVVSATLSDYFSDFRSAVGVGLQYLLPVGPARFDIAWNPGQRESDGEKRYQMHFSLGMSF